MWIFNNPTAHQKKKSILSMQLPYIRGAELQHKKTAHTCGIPTGFQAVSH